MFVGLFLLDAQEVTLAWPKDKEVWLLPPKVFLPFVKEEQAMNCWDQINLRLDEILNVAFGLFQGPLAGLLAIRGRSLTFFLLLKRHLQLVIMGGRSFRAC